MKIGEFCTYAPKSTIKAGEAVSNAEYMFFTSSADENKRFTEYQMDCEGVIMGTGGNATLHYYSGKFSVSTDCIVLRPDARVKCKYLFYFLKANMSLLEAGFKGAGLKHTNKNYISDINIDELPGIAKQEFVIDVLDRVQAIISGRQQELEKLDELIKARFAEMISRSELEGSEETTIGAITERVKVGFVGTCEKYYTDESGIPMLRTGNITEKGIRFKDLKYVSKDFHEKNKKSQIHAGDLLIARHGSNGQANVYYGPEAQCLNAVIIVPNLNIARPVFLAEIINSPKVKAQIERTLVGSTQHIVNTKSIASLTVKIPNMAVQMQCEEFVKQVNKSKDAVQKALDGAQLLFDSLMQQFFGSKVV